MVSKRPKKGFEKSAVSPTTDSENLNDSSEGKQFRRKLLSGSKGKGDTTDDNRFNTKKAYNDLLESIESDGPAETLEKMRSQKEMKEMRNQKKMDNIDNTFIRDLTVNASIHNSREITVFMQSEQYTEQPTEYATEQAMRNILQKMKNRIQTYMDLGWKHDKAHNKIYDDEFDLGQKKLYTAARDWQDTDSGGVSLGTKMLTYDSADQQPQAASYGTSGTSSAEAGRQYNKLDPDFDFDSDSGGVSLGTNMQTGDPTDNRALVIHDRQIRAESSRGVSLGTNRQTGDSTYNEALEIHNRWWPDSHAQAVRESSQQQGPSSSQSIDARAAEIHRARWDDAYQAARQKLQGGADTARTDQRANETQEQMQARVAGEHARFLQEAARTTEYIAFHQRFTTDYIQREKRMRGIRDLESKDLSNSEKDRYTGSQGKRESLLI